MNRVQVVGLGLGPEDLSPRLMEVVEGAEVIAGGERLLALFPDHSGTRLLLKFNLAQWLDQVAGAAEAGRRVAVLASGDPGYFGIAARLVERLGREKVEVHPNVSSLQAMAARLGVPWQDMVSVSLHGRDSEAPLWAALWRHPSLAVLTDPKHTPAWLAGRLLARGQEHWSIAVAEDLGADGERVAEYGLAEAAEREFSPLNLVILKRLRESDPLTLGAPEEAYTHSAGLITKAEVRAAALGLLSLGRGQVVWDLGAGSGSVGLEAGLVTGGAPVCAVEKSPARAKQIRANRAKFGAGWLQVVEAALPAGLDDLPAPDRVFIGGGGRDLGRIIAAAAARLNPGGAMVVSLVRLESLEAARRALAEAGLAPSVVQLGVSREAPLAGGGYLKALNPVFLVRGVKPGEEEKA